MSEDELPEVEERRRILEQARSELRRKGFVFQLEAVSQGAQFHTDEGAKKKALAELRQNADNCYAGAKEMTRMLGELPEPAKPPEKKEEAKETS